MVHHHRLVEKQTKRISTAFVYFDTSDKMFRPSTQSNLLRSFNDDGRCHQRVPCTPEIGTPEASFGLVPRGSGSTSTATAMNENGIICFAFHLIAIGFVHFVEDACRPIVLSKKVVDFDFL